VEAIRTLAVPMAAALRPTGRPQRWLMPRRPGESFEEMAAPMVPLEASATVAAAWAISIEGSGMMGCPEGICCGGETPVYERGRLKDARNWGRERKRHESRMGRGEGEEGAGMG
jgi:hypothetical protein